MRILLGKVRPQIFLAIIAATIFGIVGMWFGYMMGAVEVITALIGGLMGFLGGVSLKVLENE